MKKVLAVFLTMLLALTLFGCGSSDEPLNLEGTWKEAKTDSTYHEAEVKGKTITIYWVNPEEDTKALYWAGSVDIPENTTTKDTFEWTSKNDKEQTASAIMASNDDTKVIKYENGQLSYSASMMGVTKTVKLEKQETK